MSKKTCDHCHCIEHDKGLNGPKCKKSCVECCKCGEKKAAPFDFKKLQRETDKAIPPYPWPDPDPWIGRRHPWVVPMYDDHSTFVPTGCWDSPGFFRVPDNPGAWVGAATFFRAVDPDAPSTDDYVPETYGKSLDVRYEVT